MFIFPLKNLARKELNSAGMFRNGGVNSLVDDALVPGVAKSSATMVLALQYK